jgi:hypothetical protein
MANPINTPDPLTKYKWWILSVLALLMAAALRRLCCASRRRERASMEERSQALASPAARNAALLNALKEELFALESDKIAGKISPAEYAELKAALEIVLKRALKR